LVLEPNRCGVWVPACAGTTLSVLQVHPQNDFPVRLSDHPLNAPRDATDGQFASAERSGVCSAICLSLCSARRAECR